jgi:hypothetical protein
MVVLYVPPPAPPVKAQIGVNVIARPSRAASSWLVNPLGYEYLFIPGCGG